MSLEIVRKLKPVKFRFEPPYDDGKEHFGFIAQDLIEIFPEDAYGIVFKDVYDYYKVNYHEIIPHLVKAIQELEGKVNKLEKG